MGQPFRLFTENPGNFTLQDMYTQKPVQNAQRYTEMINEYNKTVPRDQQFYGPDKRFVSGITPNANMQTAFDGLQETNGYDTIRYFHPKTRFVADPTLDWGTLGQVDRQEYPDTMHLNASNLFDNLLGKFNSKKVGNTMLHEATHIDDNMRKDHKADLFGEVPGFNYEQLIRKLPEDVKKQHLTAANAEDGSREMRANFRASLGSAPRGTSEEDHFKSVLDAQDGWTNPIYYYPADATGMFDKVNLRSREEILRGMMHDMFPRERWLEPREPTWKERLQDKIDSIKSYLTK